MASTSWYSSVNAGFLLGTRPLACQWRGQPGSPRYSALKCHRCCSPASSTKPGDARIASRQSGLTRGIGMLVGFDDPNIKTFDQELERLGWSEGRNIQIDYRYAPAGTQVQALAKELVALQPAVSFAQSRPATAALQRET